MTTARSQLSGILGISLFRSRKVKKEATKPLPKKNGKTYLEPAKGMVKT
jgi:hypothetical protein